MDLTTLLTSAADKNAREALSKLLLHAFEPYCITSTTLPITIIEQDVTPNTTFADWASLANPPIQLQKDTIDGKHNQSASRAAIRNSAARNNQLQKDKSNGSQTKVYTLDHIVKHFGIRRQKEIYIVPWYGYTAHGDRIVPPKTIPQHFINTCWNE